MLGSLFTNDTLTIRQCPVCFIHYAAPEDMFIRKEKDGGNWYCPNGHNIVFRESLADKLKRKVASLESNNQYLRESKGRTERQLSAHKGQVTKIKNRIANGVCPCCKRTFADVARHMKNQHPDFATVSE